MDLERMFDHHPPINAEQVERYVKIRTLLKETAYAIQAVTPASAEQTLAIRHLEQAMFYANASVARHDVISY